MTDSRLDRIASLHKVKHGYDSQNRPYIICDYDKTPWPCLTERILEGEEDA